MKCKEIEFASGECGYNIMLPYLVGLKGEAKTQTKMITVDKCILPEIIQLWEQGIRTTGCCCGHDKFRPFISVLEGFDQKMIELGYERYIRDALEIENNLADDILHFVPKTKFNYESANKGFNWWDNN